jgi:crotonobetaine/carnitine-CoA ligase
MQIALPGTLLSDSTVRDLLDGRVRDHPDHILCRFEDQEYSVRELTESSDRLAHGLLQAGIARGDRVLVMLPQHVDHVITIFALLRSGIVWVPVNVHSKGEALAFIAAHAQPVAAIVDEAYRDAFEPVLAAQNIRSVIWRGRAGASLAFEVLASGRATGTLPLGPGPDDVVCLSYSSGTTGEPKGSLVTDRGLRTGAQTCIHVAGMARDDVMLLWEPLYHLAGGQVPLIALLTLSTFALVPRFSATRFWAQAKQHGVTHVHYLGGVLPILLKQPTGPADRDHNVRVAWGGGCPIQVWRMFEERFGVTIREGYGLTEITSFVTANRTSTMGSIGCAIPPFEVRIFDDDCRPVHDGETGEIVVKPQVPGLASKGYFRNAEATAGMQRDGWFHTGDLGYRNEDGYFYFVGRQKDSVRRRGENVSAWEVERVINQHPAVEESALIGVPSELGEDDLKIILRLVKGEKLEPLDLIRWCEDRMPYFQIPRYVAFADDFPRTPTQRVKKPDLPRTTEDCWDLEASGYILTRNGRIPEREAANG